MSSVIAIPLIASGINLATEIFSLIGDEKSKAHAKELIDLKMELLDETSKPMQDQNDGKVEYLQAKIAILQDLATVELRNYANKK